MVGHSSPGDSDGPGPDPSARASDLQEIIQRLRSSLADIQDVLLADSQGLPLVSTFTDVNRETRLAAITSLLGETSSRATQEMDFAEATHVIVTGRLGYVFVREVVAGLYLAMAVRPGVNWAELVPRVNWAVLKLAGLLQREGER